MSPTATKPRSVVRAAAVRGKLDWRALLGWLREDGWIGGEDVQAVIKRFGGADSSQHPLVRLGSAGLKRAGTQTALDTEVLTQWLAQRFNLTYLRIDPLKVDVGRVADVMSVHYAEVRHVLPVKVGATEVTIATAEPFDNAWVPEIEAHTRKTIRLVLANPLDVARYTTEFFSLAKSVRAAQKTGENSAAANFEQLVELGKTNKQLDANDAGVVQVVDWLWQYAFDQRASDIHLEPRRDMGADPLSHRRRLAHRLPSADDGDERDDRAHQAARSHGRDREAPPAGRPHQDQAARRRGRRRRRGRDAAVDHPHRLRREDGDAHLRSRHHGQDGRGAGLLGARRRALEPADQPDPRHHPRHRPHRQRQDHHAVLHAEDSWPPTRSTSARSKTRSR